MWLFTPFGYFSVVAHRADKRVLLVRARVAKDLANLRKKYLPSLSKTVLTPLADYPARATVGRKAFAKAVAKIALDIDYDNFKSEVGRVQGQGRAHAYLEIWQATRRLQPMMERFAKIEADLVELQKPLPPMPRLEKRTASGPYAGLPLAWRAD